MDIKHAAFNSCNGFGHRFKMEDDDVHETQCERNGLPNEEQKQSCG
jgi:hypothetical protein